MAALPLIIPSPECSAMQMNTAPTPHMRILLCTSGVYVNLLTSLPNFVGEIPFELFVEAAIFLMAVNLLLCELMLALVLPKELCSLWLLWLLWLLCSTSCVIEEKNRAAVILRL
jgi:hypothetical protein